MANKELPYYVVPVLAVVLLLVVNITLINTAGTGNEDWLGANITWGILDKVGLVLFNLVVIAFIAGVMGVWGIFTSDAKGLSRLWAVSLVASIALLYI